MTANAGGPHFVEGSVEAHVLDRRSAIDHDVLTDDVGG